MRWKKNVFQDGSDFNIETPRYQLMLGDLHELPLELSSVGR